MTSRNCKRSGLPIVSCFAAVCFFASMLPSTAGANEMVLHNLRKALDGGKIFTEVAGEVIQGRSKFTLKRQDNNVYAAIADSSAVDPGKPVTVILSLQGYMERKIEMSLVNDGVIMAFHLAPADATVRDVHPSGVDLFKQRNFDAALALYEVAHARLLRKPFAGTRSQVTYNYARALKDVCIELGYRTCDIAREYFKGLLDHESDKAIFGPGRNKLKVSEIKNALAEIDSFKIANGRRQIARGNAESGRRALMEASTGNFGYIYNMARSFAEECRKDDMNCDFLPHWIQILSKVPSEELRKNSVTKAMIHEIEIIYEYKTALSNRKLENYQGAALALERLYDSYVSDKEWAAAAQSIGLNNDRLAADTGQSFTDLAFSIQDQSERKRYLRKAIGFFERVRSKALIGWRDENLAFLNSLVR